MTTFYIYADSVGHDSIAVRFKDYTDKRRVPSKVWRNGVAYAWTGYRYQAENRELALERYFEE